MPIINSPLERRDIRVLISMPDPKETDIAEHLSSIFEQIFNRRDMTELNIFFEDAEAKKAFFSWFDAIPFERWLSFFKNNDALKHLKFSRFYVTEENKPRIPWSDHLLLGADIAFLRPHLNLDDDYPHCNGELLLDMDKTVIDQATIATLFTSCTDQETHLIHEALFRNIAFRLFLSEEEQLQLADATTDAIDTMIQQKAFSELMARFDKNPWDPYLYTLWSLNTRGPRFFNGYEIRLNQMPVRFITALFDQALKYKTPVLHQWGSNYDVRGWGLTDNLILAMEKQLAEGKELPLRKVKVIELVPEDLMLSQHQDHKGKGTLQVVSVVDVPGGRTLYQLGRFQKLTDPSLCPNNFIVELKAVLRMGTDIFGLNAPYLNILMKIHANFHQRLRQRSIQEHQQADDRPISDPGIENVTPEPIPHVVVPRAYQPRAKTGKASKAGPKIQQQLQASASTQTTQQQISMTQIRQRLQLLESQQVQQNAQQEKALPDDAGQLIRRNNFVTWHSAYLGGRPSRDPLPLWDSLTSTLTGSPETRHHERIDAISESALKTLLQNPSQFAGGLEFHSGSNHLPIGFYISTHPDTQETCLFYNRHFYAQASSTDTSSLRHRVLEAHTKPDVPWDLLYRIPEIQSICLEICEWRALFGGDWDSETTHSLYDVMQRLSLIAHPLLTSGGTKALKELLEEIMQKKKENTGILEKTHRKSNCASWRTVFDEVEKSLKTFDPATAKRESYWRTDIESQLNPAQKEVTKDFTCQEWMRLETIFFKLGHEGVSEFLSAMSVLKTTREAYYETFRSIFLNTLPNWGEIVTPQFASQVGMLSQLSPGGFALWKTLVEQHQQHAAVVDFSEMMTAFQGFLEALRKVDPELTIPQDCTVVDAKNFFTSLSRLLTIIRSSLDPQEQLNHLSGLSLSAVGAAYPCRHEGFHAVRTTMALMPDKVSQTSVSLFTTHEQMIKEALSDQDVSCEDLQVLLHRYLAKIPYRLPFEAYEALLQALIAVPEQDNKFKKLAFVLSVFPTLGQEQLSRLSTEVQGLNTEVICQQAKVLLEKVSTAAGIEALFPLPFNPQPTLPELTKWLGFVDTQKNVSQAINTMQALLSRFGVLAWTLLILPEISNLQELEAHLSGLNLDSVGDFLSRIDDFLDGFDEDEKALLRSLIQLIPAHEMEVVGKKMIQSARAYKQTQSLTALLPLWLDRVRHKKYTAACVADWMSALVQHPMPLSIIHSFIFADEVFEPSSQDMTDTIIPMLSEALSLSGRQQQHAAALLAHKILVAKLAEPQEIFSFFVSGLKYGMLDATRVKYVLAALNSNSLKLVQSIFNHENDFSDMLYHLLDSNPGLLSCENLTPKLLPVFLRIIYRQVGTTSLEDATALLATLAKDPSIIEYIEALYEAPPYPPIAALRQVLERKPIDLTSLDTTPYAERDRRTQLDQSRIFGQVSEFESLLSDREITEEQRERMISRLLRLNALAKTNLSVETTALESTIQAISSAEDRSEEDLLKLLACLREYAYRTVPGEHGKGLFANTSQLLAILDFIFHKGNLGLQVSTGEGKTLIIALMSSFSTLTSNRSIDLVTSNATLASRDLAAFRVFYEGCGIKTSLVTARAPFDSYLQHQRGINITDMGSLALFQNKYLYESQLRTVENDLFLDEGDDALLDKRTLFNHPKQLKGDAGQAASSESPVSWVYPHLMAFIETGKFKNGKTREEDVQNAMEYLRIKGNVEVSALVPLAKSIDIWLDAALTVKTLVKDVNYRVVNETRVIDGEEVKVRYARIATDGRLDYEAQWGDGVQQLLHAQLNMEAKTRGEPENFVIDPEQDIVLSSTAKNIMRRYKARRIVSLTATPGSTAECYECSRKYGMDFHRIPAHNRLNRTYLPTWYAEDHQHYEKLIERQILDCHKYHRPLVIICETHQDVERLHAFLKKQKSLSKIAIQMLTGEVPEQENKIVSQAGKPGMITISTAMISRGTDIQLENPENGLRVLQTFLSRERIGIQVAGRAGRRGQYGEYGLLLDVSRYQSQMPADRFMPSRYYQKHTTLMQEMWGNLELKEVFVRQREESIGDIRGL